MTFDRGVHPAGGGDPEDHAVGDAASRPVYIGQWRIDVARRVGVERFLPAARIARVVARALEAAGAPGPASVTVVLSDDAELADLNATHLGVEGPTDVLSFPMLPPEAFPAHAAEPWPRGEEDRSDAIARIHATFAQPLGRRMHVGDIVISVERAAAQARDGRGGQTGDVRWSPADEIRLLAVHGTLHLCGWDHAEPDEETAMRALEQRLLAEDRR
jgi:probable rRNA maturation factor